LKVGSLDIKNNVLDFAKSITSGVVAAVGGDFSGL
jgi:hypothetical protein